MCEEERRGREVAAFRDFRAVARQLLGGYLTLTTIVLAILSYKVWLRLSQSGQR